MWIKRRTVAIASVTAAAATAAVAAFGSPVGAATGKSGKPIANAVGLTDKGKLVAFDVQLKDRVVDLGTITGLDGDTSMIGIDYRVQDGRVYGVGDAGGVYTLDTGTAAATKVSQLAVALSGAHFGVDFNPAADRLRIVSDTGQNLRHNVNAGGTTLVDTTLTTPPATTPTTGVDAAAYTNNDLVATTATTLFDLNPALDQVLVQSPANSGQLAVTGSLGSDAGSDAGFDIHSDLTNGAASANHGYATLAVDGRYRLYSIDLLTGDASFKGNFPTRAQVSDLAVIG